MRTKFSLLAYCFLICACATAPVAHPTVAGTGIAADITNHNFKVSQAKHDYLVRQGVPPDWFDATPNDKAYPFRLSQELEGYTYDILQKDRNP